VEWGACAELLENGEKERMPTVGKHKLWTRCKNSTVPVRTIKRGITLFILRWRLRRKTVTHLHFHSFPTDLGYADVAPKHVRVLPFGDVEPQILREEERDNKTLPRHSEH
jgi:hypothetical protein